jgi:hypothetical protein
MMDVKDGLLVALIGIGFVLLVIFLLAFPIWLLYPIVVNAVFPGLIFSGAIASKISFLEALAISLFCNILFKGQATTKSNKD